MGLFDVSAMACGSRRSGAMAFAFRHCPVTARRSRLSNKPQEAASREASNRES